MEDFKASAAGPPDDLVLQISGNMTIHYAEEMKSSLLAALGGSSTITCNLENVSEIDLAGLQLLCALHKSSCSAGKLLKVVGLEGATLKKTLLSAGFSRHIGCMNNENNPCLWVGGVE